MKNFLIFLLCSFILRAALCFAGDHTEEIKGPQLFFEATSSLEPEELSIAIGPKTVSTKYSIRNTGDTAWQGQLSFILNEAAWDAVVGWYPDRRFAELAVWIDGEKVQYQTEAKGYFKGQDITERLIEAGLDVNDVNTVPETLKKIDLNADNRSKLQALTDDEIIYSHPEPKDSDSFVLIQPNWAVKNKYYWLQTFPAHKVSTVEYTYHYLDGYEIFDLNDPVKKNRTTVALEKSGLINAEDLFEKICLEPNKITHLLPAKEHVVNWLSFDLHLIKWAHPIKHFSLSVVPGDHDAKLLFSTCINGQKYLMPDGLKISQTDVMFAQPVFIGKTWIYIK